MSSKDLLFWIRQVQAIAQTGLTFSENPFDRERYEKLQQLMVTVLSQSHSIPPGEARELWRSEAGYATPKVDVRAGVFDAQGQILLVRERVDGCWSTPGGWADVNASPAEAVEAEVLQESGYRAKAVKLAAVYDRNKHEHDPYIYHVYKLLFVCEMTGGEAAASHETDQVGFFDLNSLPQLSTARITLRQIKCLAAHNRDRALATEFD